MGTTIPTSIAASNISATTAETKVLTVVPTIDTGTRTVDTGTRTVTLITSIVVANSAAVTIVFTSSSGIKNPTVPRAYGTTGTTRPLIVKTSVYTDNASPSSAYSIGAFVSFTPTAGAKRGETVTVTGGGLAPNPRVISL